MLLKMKLSADEDFCWSFRSSLVDFSCRYRNDYSEEFSMKPQLLLLMVATYAVVVVAMVVVVVVVVLLW